MFNKGVKTRTLQTIPSMCSNEERFELLGAQVCLKADAEQTGGVFDLFDAVCPPGFATPLHIHYTEDVAILVLEGALTFFWGDEKRQASAGTFLFQPKGTPHGFCVQGPAPARILYLTIPAGFDQFILKHRLTDPKSKLESDAARFKIEILGSLPE